MSSGRRDGAKFDALLRFLEAPKRLMRSNASKTFGSCWPLCSAKSQSDLTRGRNRVRSEIFLSRQEQNRDNERRVSFLAPTGRLLWSVKSKPDLSRRNGILRTLKFC